MVANCPFDNMYIENEITLDFLVEFNPLMEDQNEKQVNISNDVSAISKNKCKIPHGKKIFCTMCIL